MEGYFIKTSEDISFLKDKQIFQITILYDKLNYYVSFQYKDLKENEYNNHNYDKVGIDVGLKTFAVQSDNKISKLPKRKIIKIEKRINKLNKILSKKQKGSNNYNKVRIKLNKCYKRITNIRRDFLNKYTTWLCKNYKEIHIENLNINGMLKNHKMAKAISRSSFDKFKWKLEYKSKFYDNKIVLVDTWYASSKICHCCGNKKKSLKLSDRVYVCDKCGYIQDRDLNAALNIRDWDN